MNFKASYFLLSEISLPPSNGYCITLQQQLQGLLAYTVSLANLQVMPILINVLHQSKEEERKALVENLASLVTLLRQHLRKWLPDLLHLIHIFWTSDTQLQAWLLRLISELAGGHFYSSVYLLGEIASHDCGTLAFSDNVIVGL